MDEPNAAYHSINQKDNRRYKTITATTNIVDDSFHVKLLINNLNHLPTENNRWHWFKNLDKIVKNKYQHIIWNFLCGNVNGVKKVLEPLTLAASLWFFVVKLNCRDYTQVENFAGVLINGASCFHFVVCKTK